MESALNVARLQCSACKRFERLSVLSGNPFALRCTPALEFQAARDCDVIARLPGGGEKEPIQKWPGVESDCGLEITSLASQVELPKITVDAICIQAEVVAGREQDITI